MEEEGCAESLVRTQLPQVPAPKVLNEGICFHQAPPGTLRPQPWGPEGLWVVRAERGDLSRVEDAPGAPCKGTSVVSHHAGDTHPSAPGIRIASGSGFSFLPCITVKITIRRVAESTHRASSIFIKIFFAHNVPNLFLCSRYLESHSF